MRNKKLTTVIICVVIVLLCMFCGYSVESGTPYFPVAKGETGMEALATGILILDDGYLRLSPSYSDDTYLIIWPRGYSLDTEGDEIRILNEGGQIVAGVGDTISAAGGEMKWISSLWLKGGFLPFNCDGPYWVASEVTLI